MDISIIIPTYNRKEILQKNLNSVFQQSFKDSYEVIVVDDGSTDNTAEFLEELQKEHKNFYYKLQENKGPGLARNLAVAVAQGEILVFLDDDCIISETFLEEVVGVFKRHPDVSAFYGEAAQVFIDNLFSPLNDYYNFENEDKKESVYSVLNPFFRLRTDCCAIKKKVFDGLGGFAKEFSFIAEDVDLGYRLLQAGHRGCTANISVKHYQRKDVKALIKRHFKFGYHEVKCHKKYFSKSFIVEFRDIGFLRHIYIPRSFFTFYIDITFFKVVLVLALFPIFWPMLAIVLTLLFLSALLFKFKSLSILLRFSIYKLLSGGARFCGHLLGSLKNGTFYC
jgi:glycosyltransferase involved in cell wall biosynthesis